MDEPLGESTDRVIFTKWGNSVFTTSRWLFHEWNEWNNDDELWKQYFLILWMEFFMEFEWNDHFVWICSPCIHSYQLWMAVLTQSYDIEFDRKFRTQLYGLDWLYAALKGRGYIAWAWRNISFMKCDWYSAYFVVFATSTKKCHQECNFLTRHCKVITRLSQRSVK